MRLTRAEILANPMFKQVFEVVFLDEKNEERSFTTSLGAHEEKVADENAALNIACSKVEKQIDEMYGKEKLNTWMHVETKEIV